MKLLRVAVVVSLAVPACLGGGDDQASSLTQEVSGPGAEVVVNECMSGSSGWLEVVNTGTATVDLAKDPAACWYVDDIPGGGSPKVITDSNVNHPAGSTTCASAGRGASCGLVAPGEHAWVGFAYFNPTTADECRVLTTTKTGTACGTDYAVAAYGGATTSTSAGQCFGRQPDGAPWATGSIACSKGAANPCAVAACDDGNECTTGEMTAIDCSCGGGTPLSDVACGTNSECVAGVCTDVSCPADPCDDGNPCTAGEVVAPDCSCGGGSPLSGTACGPNMECVAGVCTDLACAPDPCDDGNACTAGETVAPDCSCGGGAPLTGTACGPNMVCDAGACVAVPPAGPVLSHLGRPDRLLLSGTIIAPDGFFDGQVLVEDTTITCVQPGTACAAMPGAVDATVIDTAGIISPGLVDTHNHVLFDSFDASDWTPQKIYDNHNQWPAEPRYKAMLDVKQCLANDSLGKPAWCANTPYGTSAGSLRCEMDKYGELKQLVGGTTSVVGLPGTSAACFGSLARSIDTPQNGLGMDKIQTSSLFPPSKSSADSVCANFASDKTDAYLIHCGEGTDQPSLDEFEKLGTVSTIDYCLYAPQTTITHGIAFTSIEFTIMANAGMKLTWSPASNLYLHGDTADIPTALDAGVTVALAPDWSIGGSQNMLDELRFADAWDNTHWNNRLAAKDLVEMATINGAKVLALDDRLGQIKPGYLADIAVFAGDRSQPYDAIVAARPSNVTLVMVGGTVLYGDAVLQAAGPAAPGCETLDICGADKFLCVATTSTANKLNQTFAQIAGKLSQAMVDADAQTTADGFDFAPIAPLVTCD